MKSRTKIAVSIPVATFQSVERARRRLRKSRSAVVAAALEEWLRGQEVSEADRRYVEGYLRVPEAASDFAVAGVKVAEHWEPWT